MYSHYARNLRNKNEYETMPTSWDLVVYNGKAKCLNRLFYYNVISLMTG